MATVSHFTTLEIFEEKVRKLASDHRLNFSGPNEQDKVEITGTATGGTFTLTFQGNTTNPIAYDANASTVKAALEALTDVDAGDVDVYDGPLPDTPIIIEAMGNYAARDITLTGNFSALTGSPAPDGVITEIIKGGAADRTVMLRRLNEAYNIIAAVLVPRGLTPTQLSTWVRGEEFQLDIATYWYAKDCGWGGKLVDEVDWTSVFNRVDELKDVAVLNDSGAVLLDKNEIVAVGMDLLNINESLGIEY